MIFKQYFLSQWLLLGVISCHFVHLSADVVDDFARSVGLDKKTITIIGNLSPQKIIQEIDTVTNALDNGVSQVESIPSELERGLSSLRSLNKTLEDNMAVVKKAIDDIQKGAIQVTTEKNNVLNMKLDKKGLGNEANKLSKSFENVSDVFTILTKKPTLSPTPGILVQLHDVLYRQKKRIDDAIIKIEHQVAVIKRTMTDTNLIMNMKKWSMMLKKLKNFSF